ncbi:MAG: hypothetical protein KC457_32395, partial [Myxococcales bacterium]|nr:hypothetical protein [Myxococcales bacterium]
FLAFDASGNCLISNPAAGRMLQKSPDEILGRHITQILPAARPSETGDGPQVIEIGGRSLAITRSASLNRGRGGRSVVVLRDVTDILDVERLKRDIISTVSHELRTPLTSIRGSLGLLDGGIVGALEPRVQSLVKIALGNTERLIRLVNDILDLDKIETGKLELRHETLDPVRLVEDAISEISGFAGECGVNLVREFEEACPIQGDRDRLVQVLINLLSNAIKFSKPGDTVTVEIEEISPGTVRFSVCDEGPGIPEAQMPKLFRKFSQLDESDTRSVGGSGLGLAISKAIVDAHGGGIGVESQPGVGSRFHFAIGESEADRPQRRYRAESSPLRAVERPKSGDDVLDRIYELIGRAVVLIGSPTSDADRSLTSGLQRHATELARHRGLAVQVRAALIRVASAFGGLANSAGPASERDRRQVLAEALRSLEDSVGS